MSTETDPLSDAECREWQNAMREADMPVTSTTGWQEARRRATDKRDEDLESLHRYYHGELNRLRELLAEMIDLGELAKRAMDGTWTLDDAVEASKTPLDGCPQCQRIVEISAELPPLE